MLPKTPGPGGEKQSNTERQERQAQREKINATESHMERHQDEQDQRNHNQEPRSGEPHVGLPISTAWHAQPGQSTRSGAVSRPPYTHSEACAWPRGTVPASAFLGQPAWPFTSAPTSATPPARRPQSA